MRCPQEAECQKEREGAWIEHWPRIQERCPCLCVRLWLTFCRTDYLLGLKAAGFTGGRRQHGGRFLISWGECFSVTLLNQATLIFSLTPLWTGLVLMSAQLPRAALRTWAWLKTIIHPFSWVIWNPALFQVCIITCPYKSNCSTIQGVVKKLEAEAAPVSWLLKWQLQEQYWQQPKRSEGKLKFCQL